MKLPSEDDILVRWRDEDDWEITVWKSGWFRYDRWKELDYSRWRQDSKGNILFIHGILYASGWQATNKYWEQMSNGDRSGFVYRLKAALIDLEVDSMLLGIESEIKTDKR